MGFMPSEQVLSSFTIHPTSGLWRSSERQLAAKEYRPCSQRETPCGCNWMIEAQRPEKECMSCGLTKIIPQLSVPGNAELWAKAEYAKRRVITQLLRLGLPVRPKSAFANGLAFDFLEPLPGQTVLTGHENGVITLNIKEADDVQRETVRESMGEKYRTLAGHMRHELGHYYWDLLATDPEWLDLFRDNFGDERNDYGVALQTHHANGAPANWPEFFISAYASSHPWEDWAETFAHYLHLEEGLHMAVQLGLEPNKLRLHATPFNASLLEKIADSKTSQVFVKDINRWIRLSLAVNELAQGLGHAHISPFVLNFSTVKKLWLVHTSIHHLHEMDWNAIEVTPS